MVTRFEAQKVRSELLEWGRHHTPPVQLRCVNIALNLERLVGEPDNLTLCRETARRIASLEETVRTENAASALGYSGNDKPPLQQHERNTDRRDWAKLHRRCWPSFLVFCSSSSVEFKVLPTVASP